MIIRLYSMTDAPELYVYVTQSTLVYPLSKKSVAVTFACAHVRCSLGPEKFYAEIVEHVVVSLDR